MRPFYKCAPVPAECPGITADSGMSPCKNALVLTTRRDFMAELSNRYEKHLPPVTGEPPARSGIYWPWRSDRVFVEHVGDSAASIRVVLIHGAGGNSQAMWPYAAHLAQLGTLVTVPNMPGYGGTRGTDPGAIRYGDWRQMLIDLLRHEADERPLVLVGASMGGMLAYDTAAVTDLVDRLVVTCLLDPRDPAVRRRLTWHPALAAVAGSALKLLAGPLARLRVPIRWIADMRHIANEPGLVREVLSDRRGGGGRVPLGWMRSYLESTPIVEPEAFERTPVLMLHPQADRWTPVSISQPFFDRIAADKKLVLLEGCGHFPAEQPGFGQFMQEMRALLSVLRLSAD